MKYHTFLIGQQVRTRERHHLSEPIRSKTGNFSVMPVPKSDKPVKECYVDLDKVVRDSDCYDPIFLDSFAPKDRSERCDWIESILLSTDINKYTYFHGNYLGNVVVVWRLPPETEKHETGTLRAIEQVHQKMPTYATRAMRQNFYDRYQCSVNISPTVLRDMYRFLTNDMSAPEDAKTAEIDQRMSTFLDTDDPDLIVDLRSLNGKTGNSKYDVFWDEMQRYFNEQVLAVQERRHGEHLYLPFAMSVCDLVETIKARVPSDTAIPSNEWVRLHFLAD